MPKIHDKVTRKPEWLKIKLHRGTGFAEVAKAVGEGALHTICESGQCPNQAECWSRRTATLMIMGDICTRSCRFCATKTGKPFALDPTEPVRAARTVKAMGLRYCVITSVDRDDLSDRGASHWAAVVSEIKKINPQTRIELLIPDFDGEVSLVETVMASAPNVIGHNIETVEALTPQIRSRARYHTSLEVIRMIACSGIPAKSGLMLGLGETDSQIERTLDDLAEAGCRILTIGQYLQPTRKQREVARYVHPDEFARYKEIALSKGFTYVQSGPLVRSSYLADQAAAPLAMGLPGITTGGPASIVRL